MRGGVGRGQHQLVGSRAGRSLGCAVRQCAVRRLVAEGDELGVLLGVLAGGVVAARDEGAGALGAQPSGAVDDLGVAALGLLEAVRDLPGSVGRVARAVGELAGPVGDLAQAVVELARAVRGSGRAVGDLRAAVGQLAQAVVQLGTAGRELRDAVREVVGVLTS